MKILLWHSKCLTKRQKNAKKNVMKPRMWFSFRHSMLAGAPLRTTAAPALFRHRGSLARSWSLRFGVSLVFGVWFLVFSSHAQYSIDWFKIAGGGGTSTGGVYSVIGTIGQPDAGPVMTNGQYALTGGFWALPQAVQVVGSPILTITPSTTPGSATISWTPNTPGFVLQETFSLKPPNWTNSISGSTNPVTISLSQAFKYYRLAHP
ncbi:MAG: hypothetical protein C5B50_00270 [Verrucomicrobia bacterium]|nr:MAG: hypothetical protein C5B50_00270 [Verrucomicrobiota bacterium]